MESNVPLSLGVAGDLDRHDRNQPVNRREAVFLHGQVVIDPICIARRRCRSKFVGQRLGTASKKNCRRNDDGPEEFFKMPDMYCTWFWYV